MTPDCVAAQIDAVFDDVQISAVKIGMLHDAGIIHAVADRLTRYRPKWIVLDPVMIAKSGAPLLEPAAIHALKAQLLPLSTVITPNLPEAATLLETSAAESDAAIHAQLNRLLRLGPQAVLIKGGHSNDPAHSTDWLLEADNAHDQLKSFTSQRICTRNDHGTGCTLSSAIAALLPQNTLTSAIRHAKAYLQAALEASDRISVGSGHGPLHHFHNLWPAR
ncbi:uncharacterized protein LOC100907206 [Galendromus occidentalis]|uniref:Uncharacterized protein LOC100907206 n=1 Tax=Galendromus occidentalis TaxID=34638 RepID=A0AAJ6QLA6_9ACAR|nr:uncharacterized protein LOC100907206 [Galendromus occidentalis]